MSARAVAVVCALAAVVAALCAVVATEDGFSDPSALVKVATTDPLAADARATEPGFVLVNPQEHYDGVYYYAIARDPLLLGDAHTKIDQAAYRYGHPFHGWAARVVSLGNDAWIPEALLLLSLAGIGAAAWAVSRLSVLFGRTPWGGLLVAMSPGLLYATTVSTTETVGAALIALVLLAWLRGRIVLAGVLMVALCLTKEQYVTVPLGLAVWEFAQWQRGRASAGLRLRAGALVAGPAALSLWYLWVHARMDTWPSSYEDGNIGVPFVGWIETFRYAQKLSQGGFDASQIGTTSPAVLIAIAVVLVAAAVRALGLRSPLDPIVLGLVAITACMSWRTLVYPHELVRNPAIVLLLAVCVLLAGDLRSPQPTPDPALDAAGDDIASGDAQ